jgi:hypothetical protein
MSAEAWRMSAEAWRMSAEAWRMSANRKERHNFLLLLNAPNRKPIVFATYILRIYQVFIVV